MDRLTMDDGIWVNFAREVIEKCDPLYGSGNNQKRVMDQ